MLQGPLGVLDRWGHGALAGETLVGLVCAQRADGSFGDGSEADTVAVLRSLALHLDLTADGAVAAAVAEAVTGAVHRLNGRGVSPDGRRIGTSAAATVLRWGGHDDVARKLGGLGAGGAGGRGATGPADPRGRWAWMEHVHRFLARVDGGDLVLLDPWPAGWDGHAVEVHGLRTEVGTVSYALRWHGDRPALLWDVVPHALGGWRPGRPERVVTGGLAGMVDTAPQR